MPSYRPVRHFSAALSSSQFAATSSAPATAGRPPSPSPKTCGWRRTSLATMPAATSSTPKAPSRPPARSGRGRRPAAAGRPAPRAGRPVARLDGLDDLVALLEQVGRSDAWVCRGPTGSRPATASRSITATRSSSRAPGTSCEAVTSSTSGGAPSIARRDEQARPGRRSGRGPRRPPSQAAVAPPSVASSRRRAATCASSGPPAPAARRPRRAPRSSRRRARWPGRPRRRAGSPTPAT